MNPSFEDGVYPNGIPVNWDFVTCEGVANANATLDSTSAFDGNYSAKVYSGPVTPTGCFGPEPGRQVGFTQFRQSLTNSLNITDLTDSPDGFSFWFKLQPYNNTSGMAGFGIRVFGAESLAELDYAIDPDPSLGTFVNNTGVHSLLFFGYQPGQWYHFSRNLRADWLNFGLSPHWPISLIQFQGYVTQSGTTVKSETFWLDDVRAYAGPSEFTLTANPQMVVLSPYNFSARLPIMTLTSSTSLAVAVRLSAQAYPASLKVSLDNSSLTLSANSQNATSLLSTATPSTIAGTYIVTVTGVSGSTSHSIDVTIIVAIPDFGLSATGPSPSLIPIFYKSFEPMKITSLDGFGGKISLTASSNSTKLNAAFPTGNITVTAFGSNSTQLVLNATSIGYYSVTVTGTYRGSGFRAFITHSVNVYVNATRLIGDFSVKSSQDIVTASPGYNSTVTIVLTSLNNFTGSINLEANVYCEGQNAYCAILNSDEPRVFLNPPNVSLAINGTETSTLTIQPPPPYFDRGTYVIEITAFGPFFYHFLNLTLYVPQPDFSITTSQTSLSIVAGDSTSLTVTLTSLYGLSGTVPLSSLSPLAFFNPGNINLSRYGTGTAALKIVTLSSTAPGTYTVIVEAGWASNSHNATLYVTVSAPPQTHSTANTTILGLDPPVFYALATALTAALLAVVTMSLFARRRKARD